MMSFALCSFKSVYNNIAQAAFVFIVGVLLSTNLEIKLWAAFDINVQTVEQGRPQYALHGLTEPKKTLWEDGCHVAAMETL